MRKSSRTLGLFAFALAVSLGAVHYASLGPSSCAARFTPATREAGTTTPAAPDVEKVCLQGASDSRSDPAHSVWAAGGGARFQPRIIAGKKLPVPDFASHSLKPGSVLHERAPPSFS